MKRACFLIASLLLAACEQQNEFTYRQHFVGHEVELVLHVDDKSKAERAAAAVMRDLKLIESYSDPQSSKPLARTNVLLQSREWFSINPSVYRQIRQARNFYDKSGGWFNPAALGAWRKLWGEYDRGAQKRVPAKARIAALRDANPSMDDIEVSGIRVRGHNKDLQLDFDLLALGYAIDTEIEQLAELDIKSALLRIGPVGRVVGIPDHAVSLPNSTDKVPLVPGEAYCFIDGKRQQPYRYFDPHTGQAVEPGADVAVIHADAQTAAATCVAILIGGKQGWSVVTRGLGLRYASWRWGDQRLTTPAWSSHLAPTP
jgi:thiamine biosynthesis lipoprotein ApbE